MNEQLDKLESSVARLVQAYNELKQENENLKAQLADKTAAVDLLEEESQAVRTRIDALVASLTVENA
jgi:chromosome segregation ATPase